MIALIGDKFFVHNFSEIDSIANFLSCKSASQNDKG